MASRGVDSLEGYNGLECVHQTLTASTDTTVTFSQPVYMVRVLNWSTTARVLVKKGAISADAATDATRVGIAPTANVPGCRTLPLFTKTLNLRSTGAAEVTVEGYF
jgi:hypothetical protein